MILVKKNIENKQIAVIGLGYFALPLAVDFAEEYPVIGLDINTNRVDELQKGKDTTLDVQTSEVLVFLKPPIL